MALTVTEFLAHLSSSPGSFESDVEYITGIFNTWVTTEELLQELVELIYTEVWRHTFSPHFDLCMFMFLEECIIAYIMNITIVFSRLMYITEYKLSFSLQSTAIPNFAYTGARLCNYLSHHLIVSPASGNFRQLLLKR